MFDQVKIKIFDSSNLITMQNVFAVCYTVWRHAGGSPFALGTRRWGQLFGIMVVSDSLETRHSPTRVTIPNLVALDQTVRAYFWRSAGKIWLLVSRHSRLLEVIGTDTVRSAAYNFLVIHNFGDRRLIDT